MPLQNSSVLVLSIETVSSSSSYDELEEQLKQLWREKHSYLIEEGESPESIYTRRGAVEAEFAKVITVGIGFLRIRAATAESLHIHVIQDESEEALLRTFVATLPESESGQLRYNLCAHNGKEFDFPFLCRRLLAYGVLLPLPLQIQHKKPWQLTHLYDTFEMWRFGDKKQFTSLPLLCHTLNIPIEKVLTEISGRKIHALYYEEKDMRTICTYTEAQLRATTAVYLRLQGVQPLPEEAIHTQTLPH